MPKFFGTRSNYSLVKKRWSKILALYAIALMMLLHIPYTIYSWFLKTSFSEWLLVTLAYFILLLTLYLIYKNRYYSALKFRKGINGEEWTYYELYKLPNTYSVFQDLSIPEKNENIDFVVLGPTGLFTIEVKNINGIISFDGKNLLTDSKMAENKPIIQQVRDQYWGVHNYLNDKIGVDCFVTPLVVFVHNKFKSEFGYDPVIEQIRVLHGKDMVKFITSRPPQKYSTKIPEIEEQIRLLCKSTY